MVTDIIGNDGDLGRLCNWKSRFLNGISALDRLMNVLLLHNSGGLRVEARENVAEKTNDDALLDILKDKRFLKELLIAGDPISTKEKDWRRHSLKAQKRIGFIFSEA